MKLSFYQLFLFLFLFFHYSQCRYDSSSSDEGNKKRIYRIYENLYKATNRTLASVLPPTCHQIIFNTNNIKAEYISSGGLSGRVLPVGTFPTEILALEYLYGILCPIPNLPPRRQTAQSIDLKRISYDKKYFITQTEFIVYLYSGRKLTFFVTTAFDKHYKLCGYDGQIRNLGLTLDEYTQQEKQRTINLICNAANIFCNGTLKEYASVNDCIQFLTNTVPYGSYDRGDQENVICRAIHTNLVPLLPEIHCPHVGPTGGGKCVDKTYEDYYNQPDFMACAHKYN